MGKNKALAHHTSTYFHTYIRVVCRFNSVAFAEEVFLFFFALDPIFYAFF